MTSEISFNKCQECIQKSTCFNLLVPTELDFISRNKEQITFQRGETICKQGAFANYVMYVADGLVKTYLETVNDKIINLKIIKDSEFIGFSSLCGKKNYNYSSVALKKSTICLLDNDSFRQLLLKNGEFTIEVMRLYCKNEEHIYNRCRTIGYKYMLGRLADALLYLCGEEFEDCDIFEYIQRKDIADFACISKESAVKLLMDLNETNVIRLSGRKIVILDKAELERFSLKG